jgi:hypothetical protein
MKATTFDQRFDRGDDVSKFLDLSAAHRPAVRVSKGDDRLS